MNTGIYLLRCKELGLSVAELDSLEYGLVLDVLKEKAIDNNGYIRRADQDDFDRF